MLKKNTTIPSDSVEIKIKGKKEFKGKIIKGFTSLESDVFLVLIGSFQKRSIFLPHRKFLPSGGGGEKKLFLIIVN
jgi:hypothetical protein